MKEEIKEKILEMHRIASSMCFEKYSLTHKEVWHYLNESGISCTLTDVKSGTWSLIRNGFLKRLGDKTCTFLPIPNYTHSSLLEENKILKARLEKAKEVYYQQKKKNDELEELVNEYDKQLVWKKFEIERYQKQLKISNMKLQQIRQLSNI